MKKFLCILGICGLLTGCNTISTDQVQLNTQMLQIVNEATSYIIANGGKVDANTTIATILAVRPDLKAKYDALLAQLTALQTMQKLKETK